MNPKIRRDPYLAPLCARHGDQAACEAGFCEDDDPRDAPLDDGDWLCTPTDPVRRGLAGGRPGGAGDRGSRPVVLVSTGGFFPVHSGHLAMMASARRAAEASGWWVVGGYLSPGHDRYLALKCGGLPMAASDRLALAAAASADHDWLAVDPWEALARRVAMGIRRGMRGSKRCALSKARTMRDSKSRLTPSALSRAAWLTRAVRGWLLAALFSRRALAAWRSSSA